MRRQPVAIALFTNTHVRAGVEEHILTLLRGLDRQRFRPYLICPAALLQAFGSDVPADVEVLSLCFDSPRHWRAGLQLVRFLRSRKIEILHSHMFQSSMYASPAGWFAGVGAVLETVHGREDWRRGWLKSRFVIDRTVGRFVDAYISVSTGCAEYLKNRKGLPAHKIHVIPNGCDLERFSESSNKSVPMRHALGLGSGVPILVVIGRLEPQKGHAVLLEALAEVRTEFAGVQLICVGEGSLGDSLKLQAEQLGLSQQVHFVGYQRNTEDWLAMADIAVLPSFYEGMPLVAIEALGAGRPMVATDVDGTSEVVVNGKTGLTVPPGNARALAEALCRLLRNPLERRMFGAAGRKWVTEQFSEKTQLRRTQELYLKLLDRPGSVHATGFDENANEPAIV